MSELRTYYGDRTGGHVTVRVRTAKGMHKLRARLDLFNHSPTGFEWGYGGSGPAQLALSILADALHDDDLAVRLHHKFKFEVIAKLPHDSWQMTKDEVEDFTARALP